jgi:hypothetical protein
LPPESFRLIATKRIGAGDGLLTVLEYLRKNNIYIRRRPAKLSIFSTKSPLPRSTAAVVWWNIGATRKFSGFIYPCLVVSCNLARSPSWASKRASSLVTGGTEIRLPGAMAYGDEITAAP